MICLNQDIIYLISHFLNFYNILNLSIVNKYTYIIFDNNYYKELSIKYYTKKFWELAKCRPIKLSKPLKSYKKEIMSIENFQNTLHFYNFRRWNNNDFYSYWNSQITTFKDH